MSALSGDRCGEQLPLFNSLQHTSSFSALCKLQTTGQQLQDNTAHCVFQATETFSSAGHVRVPRVGTVSRSNTAVPIPLLQVFILDALVNYQVQDSKDAEKIVERVLPRLQHVNSAVVLSAAKVC